MVRFSDPSARRAVVGYLLVATTINYLDRQTLSVLAPVLQKELSISSLEYSYIINSFLAVYSVMYLLVGRAVDLVGVRWGLGCGIVVWSLAEILHGRARGFEDLCLARALLAIGEAAIIPSGVKAVAEWFEAKQRGVAVGTFEIGLSLGPIIAPPLVVWLSLQWGWRSAFVWTGVLGLFWAIPWLLWYRTPSNPAPRNEGSRPVSWLATLSSRSVWAVGLARFFGDPVWYFYLFWLPKFLSEAKGLSLASIGAFAWTPYLASMLGGLSGGAISSWMIARGVDPVTARKRVLLFSSIVVSSGVLCIYLESLVWTLVSIGVAAFAMQCWGVNLDTLPGDLFPAERVAQSVGLAGMLGSLGGVAFTAAIGYLVQYYSYTPVWIATAVTYPLGLCCLHALLGRRPARSLAVKA